MATELARPEKPDEPRWNPATRVLFRFACVYLILVLLPFPFDRVPSIGWLIGGVYGEGWNQAVAWLARRLLGLELTVFTNGSGDTTYNYLLVLVHASLAVLATLLWTALDGSRPNYSRVHAWLRTYLRFALAAILFSYGAAKVFKSQFPDPPASRLLEPLGEMSPMGLLWSFMGASEAYTVFGGLAETIPAILLMFGRTTLLGALAAACTLTNVVMLNFCYDVPVKIYSLHLLAISLFLIAPDATRLLDFFVRNRTVAPRPGPAYAASSRMLTALTVAGMAGMALYAILAFTVARPSRESWAHGETQAPLHGLWTVDEFGTDGVNLIAAKDDVRWRHVTLPFPGALTIHLMNGKVRWYEVYVDEKRHLLFLTNRGDGSHASLSYAEDQEGLTLTGTLSGHMIRARLRRTALSDFPLRSRGFHWINEYPFNR